MRKQFHNIPFALQKQILIRLGGSGLGIVMLLLILAYRGSIQLLLPGIAISFSFLAGALTLFFRCVEGRYVVIRGTCESIDRSRLRKRIKAVQIRRENKTVQVSGQQHLFRNIRIGDTLVLYVADSAPVYDHDEIYVITNILAVRKDR